MKDENDEKDNTPKQLIMDVNGLADANSQTGINMPQRNSVDHKDILECLLAEIGPTDLKLEIGLPQNEEMRERHIQFAVAKAIAELAQSRNWPLRNLNDYIYVYNGAFWKQHNKDGIKKFLGDAAVKLGLPEYDAKYYRFVDGLYKQFLIQSHVPLNEPENGKILINLKNGTFEFNNGKWLHKEFDPNDFLIYQLPFSYNPAATCEKFDTYLNRVLPDDCSRDVLQEFAGYIFTRLNLERCLVLTGDGSNGKSVFFRIITALIGKENTLMFNMSAFSHESNRAKLTNVLLNYSSDSGFKLAPEIFKALVSCEPVQARELYCNPFTLYNKAKFLINCNLLPKETENTLGYFRRFLIIPFEVTISERERDINLADKIIADELPGVFNWLLAGLARLVAQQQFTHCEKAEIALADFRRTADSVQRFVEDHELQPSKTNKESLNSLYIKYVQFCKQEMLVSVGKKNFGKELEELGFERLPRTNAGIAFGAETRHIEM